MADSVFDVVVALPYEPRLKQVTANGQPGDMNIGAVVVLPEGFRLAPKDRIRRSSEQKTKGVFVQPYSRQKQNILVVGPVAGQKSRQRLHFPVLSPEPSELKESRFLTYPVYAGANRGRGQLYPNGQPSNNQPGGRVTQPTYSTSEQSYASNSATTYRRSVPQVYSVRRMSDGRTSIGINYNPNPRSPTIDYSILASGLVPSNKLQIGAYVSPGETLSVISNYGGFGQNETEFVMQKPSRLEGIFLLFSTLTVGQIVLINKKKQYEAVQAVELRF
jgi:apocytochrome f